MQNTVSQEFLVSNQAQVSQSSKHRNASINIENEYHRLQDRVLDTLEQNEQYNERQLRRMENRRIKMISLKTFFSNESHKNKNNTTNVIGQDSNGSNSPAKKNSPFP